ncbi:hypothetical protein C0995_008797 [Termitomyces sp. Mi166|nr:hypothetical protein C0995_008797 [Termitomyces sp. Mi166\
MASVFGMSTVAFFIIQGLLVLRVFYMFEHSLLARFIIAITWAFSIASAIILLAFVMHDVILVKPLSTLARLKDLIGCPVPTETNFWHLYIPAFVLHTVLYIFTLIRALNCENSLQAPLIKRLHREYVVLQLDVSQIFLKLHPGVLITLAGAIGWTEIGSGLFHHPELIELG